MTLNNEPAERFTNMRSGAGKIGGHVRTFFAAQPENWLARIGMSFATVSAFTSGYGAFQFAVALGLSPWAACVPSLAAGLAVQILVVNSIKLVARDGLEAGKMLIALLLVLAFSWTLSVSSSYGSYWNFFARDAYEQRATERRISEAVEPLNEVSIRFANATEALQGVAAHAEAMAIRERADGDSCGYFAMEGEGPRFRLREAQNIRAQQLATAMAGQNRELGTQIARMNSSDNLEIATAYRAAAATLSGSAVRTSRRFVASEREGFLNGFSEGEQLFSCSDPTMLSLLTDADEALRQLPELSSSPPRVVVISDSEGMLLSISRMWKAIFGSTQDQDVTDADLLPLAIPVVIESIMTLLLILGYRSASGGTMAVPGGFRRAARIHPDPILQMLAENLGTRSGAYQLYNAFAEHVISSKNRSDAVLVIPRELGEERELTERLRAIAEEVGKGIGKRGWIERIDGSFDFASLPPRVTSGWTWRDASCDLYRLPRQTVEKMRRMLAEHASAMVFHQARNAT